MDPRHENTANNIGDSGQQRDSPRQGFVLSSGGHHAGHHGPHRPFPLIDVDPVQAGASSANNDAHDTDHYAQHSSSMEPRMERIHRESVLSTMGTTGRESRSLDSFAFQSTSTATTTTTGSGIPHVVEHSVQASLPFSHRQQQQQHRQQGRGGGGDQDPQMPFRSHQPQPSSLSSQQQVLHLPQPPPSSSSIYNPPLEHLHYLPPTSSATTSAHLPSPAGSLSVSTTLMIPHEHQQQGPHQHRHPQQRRGHAAIHLAHMSMGRTLPSSSTVSSTNSLNPDRTTTPEAESRAVDAATASSMVREAGYGTTTGPGRSLPIGGLEAIYATQPTIPSQSQTPFLPQEEHRLPTASLRPRITRAAQAEPQAEGEREEEETIRHNPFQSPTNASPPTAITNRPMEHMQQSNQHLPYYATTMPSFMLPPSISQSLHAAAPYENSQSLGSPSQALPPTAPSFLIPSPVDTTASMSTEPRSLSQQQPRHVLSAVRDQPPDEVTGNTAGTSIAASSPSIGPIRHLYHQRHSHHAGVHGPGAPIFTGSLASSSPTLSASSSSPHFRPYPSSSAVHLHRRRSMPGPSRGQSHSSSLQQQQGRPISYEQPQHPASQTREASSSYLSQSQTFALSPPHAHLPAHFPVHLHHAHVQHLAHRPSFMTHRSSASYPHHLYGHPLSNASYPYMYSSHNQPPPHLSATTAAPTFYFDSAAMTAAPPTAPVNLGYSVDADADASTNASATTGTMPLYPQPPVPPAAQPASSTLAPSAFTSTGGFPSTTVGATASSRPTTAATSFSFGGYQSVEDSGHEIGGIPTTGDEGGDEEDEDEEIGEVNDDEEEENILVQPGEVRRVPPQQAHPQDNREQEGEEEGAAGEEEGEVGTKSKKPRDPKPHKCETCGKAFPRPSALETHKTVHSGAKPYNCPVTTCNKSFAVRSNARRHLKTHGIKLKTRDRRNRGKNARSASSLNKTLNIGESHHRDTSPDNDEGPLAGGTDFEEEGESYAAATSSSVAATASASTMTTTATATQHFVGGRVPYPTGERVLARMPGVGLRRAEHRGHVNTAADEDEVLGLAGLGIEIDPALRSEIEVIQRHVEETTEDEDDDEDEERGEGAKKSVQRQSLRLGAGRKVIIETSGIVVSKRGRQQNTSGAAPTGAATTAEASASTNIRKGKGKDVGSAAKLRGKRQGVAETRRKRGVERGVEAPSEDNGGTRAREVIEESQAPVLDEAVLRNLWASTQRGFSSSTFTAAGGAGGGEGMSSVGGGGNPSSTTSVAGSSSLPPLDQAALEKLIAAPTAWENHQRQQKLKRGLAAAATGGGGDGGVGAVAGSTSQNVDGDGGASGAGSNDLDAVIPLVHSDLAPSNVVDENVRIGGSSSAPISSHGHLPFNPPSSVRISALAPPHLVASTLYFDQTQTAIGVLNGVVMPFLPRSPEEIEVVNRPLWNSTDSSSLSSSSFSPVEDTGERNSLDSMTTATAATSTSTANAITGAIATLDRPDTYQLFIEEEAGHRRPDGTWIPESMRRFKNVHRLRNSVPFDDIGLSTLQMPFPLPAVQPTRIWVPTTSTPMSTTTTTTTIPTPTTSTVTTSTTTASSSPSQPLSPHSPKDGDNRGARNDRPSFVKMEERDSFASDIGRNPYHDTCFRQRPVLPGPAPPNLKMIRHNTMIRFRPNSITV